MKYLNVFLKKIKSERKLVRTLQFLCAMFVVVIIFLPSNSAMAYEQEWDEMYGQGFWLSDNKTTYVGHLDADKSNARGGPSPHNGVYYSSELPLDPLWTCYSFEETLNNPHDYARDENNNNIQGHWYRETNSFKKWDTPQHVGWIRGNWKSESSGTTNTYKRWTTIYYHRPRPSYFYSDKEVIKGEEDADNYVHDKDDCYWYKTGDWTSFNLHARDDVGHIEKFNVSLKKGSSTVAYAYYDFEHDYAGGFEIDRNYVSDFGIKSCKDYNHQKDAHCNFHAKVCTEGEYSVHIDVRNRGDLSLKDGTDVDTGLKIRFDGTAPTGDGTLNFDKSNDNIEANITDVSDDGIGFKEARLVLIDTNDPDKKVEKTIPYKYGYYSTGKINVLDIDDKTFQDSDKIEAEIVLEDKVGNTRVIADETYDLLYITASVAPTANPTSDIAYQGQELTFNVNTVGDAMEISYEYPSEIYNAQDSKIYGSTQTDSIDKEDVADNTHTDTLSLYVPMTIEPDYKNSPGQRLRDPYDIVVTASKDDGYSKSVTLHIDVQYNIYHKFRTKFVE